MSEQTPTPVDRDALRVLAHPLRSRILTELRTAGPAGAADLARALGTNSGATSYHVRRLEQVGLVTDATPSEPAEKRRGRGSARRRVWRASTQDRPTDVEAEDDEREDDEAAAEWLARDYVQHFAGKAHRWIDTKTDWPTTWQEECGLDDHLVLVTDEQLTRLRQEVGAVLARYRRLGAGNPSAKRISYYTCALPVDPPPQVR